MSGLLRRIKRSRPADAGEPLPEGQAAAPEGAAPATEPATAVTEPVSAETPAAAPAQPATETPVLLADPDTPAGVDPGTAALRPPAGRRGRLRRRLRYLRRARELMLRDLGGLLYEVHRTGGGNVEAHGNLVRAKVQRIAGLDAEAHALETALAAPRAEAVVFQPGVGGTCPACGELYGSDAHFCANCGTALGAAAALPAPDQAPSATPAPATRESVFGRPVPPAQALSSGDPLQSPAPDPEEVGKPAGDEPNAGDQTAVLGDAARPDSGATTSGDEPAADAPTSGDEPAAADEAAARPDTGATAPGDDATAVIEPSADEPPATAADAPASGESPEGDAGRNPFSGLRNGRADDHTPPDLSSGDPLAARERHS